MHGDKKDPSVPSFAFPIFSETATCQNYLIKSYIPSISPDYFSSSLFVIYESDQEFHDFQAPNYGSLLCKTFFFVFGGILGPNFLFPELPCWIYA